MCYLFNKTRTINILNLRIHHYFHRFKIISFHFCINKSEPSFFILLLEHSRFHFCVYTILSHLQQHSLYSFQNWSEQTLQEFYIILQFLFTCICCVFWKNTDDESFATENICHYRFKIICFHFCVNTTRVLLFKHFHDLFMRAIYIHISFQFVV